MFHLAIQGGLSFQQNFLEGVNETLLDCSGNLYGRGFVSLDSLHTFLEEESALLSLVLGEICK